MDHAVNNEDAADYVVRGNVRSKFQSYWCVITETPGID